METTWCKWMMGGRSRGDRLLSLLERVLILPRFDIWFTVVTLGYVRKHN